MSKVDPIPAEYPRVMPYLSIDGAAEAIDFYCDILGAVERVRMGGPDGKVGEASSSSEAPSSCSPTPSLTWVRPHRGRSVARQSP